MIMKKILLILAVIALAFIPSCTEKEQDTDIVYPEEEIDGGITEFTATLPSTKTQLGTPTGETGYRQWPNLWSNGDMINVNGAVSKALSTGDGYVGTNYALFKIEGVVNSPFYAAYPSSAVSYSNGSATITIPATQSWVDGSYDPSSYIMLSKSSTAKLSFSPMMGLVQLTTTAPAEGTLYIKSITVESVGDEKMSGAFTTTENYAGITGGDYTSITISAASGTTKTFGTVFTFAIPAQNYASGMRFRITAVPNADGSGDEQTMVFAKQSAFDVAAGALYPLTAPAFKESVVESPNVTTINSSTLGVSWTGSNAANNQNKAWELYVYSDSGCNTPVRTISIPKGASCWTSKMTSTVNFAVGGLNQNTTYYFKVKDIQSGIISSAGAGTTSEFTVVSMVNITSSTTGTVFAEDFSELCGFGVKYNGLEYGGCYNNTAANRLNANDWASVSFVEPETGEWKLYNSGLNDAVVGKRFAGWLGQGNAIAKCGYLKLGGAETKGWALTPAFTVAPGYMAVVTVTVNAAKYDASTIAHSVSVVHSAGSGSAARESNFSWVPAPDLDQRFDDKNAISTAWADIVTTGLYLHNGDRILFGSTESSATDNQRILMNSIKVEVTSVVPEADYLISNYETLERFMDAVGTSAESGSKSVKGMVTHDITLTESQKSSIASFYPLAGYTGILYGQSHTITGLQKPFFADLQGDVEYLTLNSTINATTDTFEEGPAIFAEELAGGGSLDHCTSQGSVTFRPSTAVIGATRYVAGLVGRVSNGTVTDCSNAANVSFPHNSQTNDMIINVGGAIGAISSSTSFSNVSNSGSVSVAVINATSTEREGRIGGVVGYIYDASSISGFNNSGAVEFTGTVYGNLSIGGVVGYTKKAISSCQNSGTITAGGAMNAPSASKRYRYVGGIAGYVSADVTLENNTNTSAGTITNMGSSTFYTLVGGISGYPNGVVSGCSNAASVSYSGSSGGTVCVGGIAGRTPQSKTGTRINNVTNSGSITVSESSSHAGKTIFVSGISAHHQSGDVLAHNSGAIVVENMHCDGVVVGALCGQAGSANASGKKASILSGSDNSDSGDISVSGITATNHCYVGGLVGRGYGSVTSASNAGDVEFTSSTGAKNVFVAGLVGMLEDVSDNSMSGSHNSGAISNEVDSASDMDISVGGLVGRSNASISSSYNTGAVSNSGDAGCDVCMGGLVGNASSITLTACYNTGAVSNSGDAAANRIIAEGGLAGWSTSSTYASACYNTGSVTNSGEGSNGGQAEDGALAFAKVGVCLGGLVGLANGANTLTSTSSTYNYNNGAVKENSTSDYIAVGGVCGYANNASTNLNYCRNNGAGDITIKGVGEDAKTNIYVGGVLGCTESTTSFDYTQNAGDIVFDGLDISGQVFAGGVHGAWTAAGTQTITGCVNSGPIKTKTTSNNTDLKSSATSPYWSFIGGISGVGGSTHEGLDSTSPFSITGKTFTNCTNSGAITIYAAFRTCIGGVVSWIDANPSGCTNTGNIKIIKNSGIGEVNGNYHRGACGGIVGINNGVTLLSNLKFKGTIDSRTSSPFSYTAGIIGYNRSNVAFSNCKVGGSMFRAAGNSDGGAALFCRENAAHAYSFTSCVVMTNSGLYWRSNIKTSITSDNLTLPYCTGFDTSTLSSGSIPSVGSID